MLEYRSKRMKQGMLHHYISTVHDVLYEMMHCAAAEVGKWHISNQSDTEQ